MDQRLRAIRARGWRKGCRDQGCRACDLINIGSVNLPAFSHACGLIHAAAFSTHWPSSYRASSPRPASSGWPDFSLAAYVFLPSCDWRCGSAGSSVFPVCSLVGDDAEHRPWLHADPAGGDSYLRHRHSLRTYLRCARIHSQRGCPSVAAGQFRISKPAQIAERA